jgi:hypothetical protein
MTLVEDNRHKKVFQFIKRLVEVPLGYSTDDLILLRSFVSQDYPAFIPLIDEYVKLAERSALDISGVGGRRIPATNTRRSGSSDMHLFDLLREKKLFQSNADLAEFAGKILPGIKGNRFDKMSRGDIAVRIIEHLETKDRRTREELEASMREAMSPERTIKPIERQSFLSKWEKIIKGTQQL